MAQPIFQPIIGGGFDQLAGQHQFWGQFNASQDAQNIARREQANREYNDWLGNVSQLQRAEAAQQDLWAREDISQALTRKAQERRETEATRQFEEGLKYSREAMRAQEKLQRDQFKQQLDLTKAEDQKENELLASFGETFAPQVARAVETLKRLDPEHEKAQMAVQTLGREYATKLNHPGVYYDGKTFSLRWAQGASVDPTVNAQMLKYNEDLGRKVAEFTGLDQSYKLAVKQLEDLQKTAGDGGFVLRDDGTIYNYKLKKAFGKPFTPQASKPPPPPTWKEKLLAEGRKNLSAWARELYANRGAAPASDFAPPAAPTTARTGTAVSPPTFQPTFGRALTPEMFSAGTGTDTNIPRWAGNAAGAAAGLLFPPVMPYVAKGMLNQATGEQPVFTPTATGTTNAAPPPMIGPDGAPLGPATNAAPVDIANLRAQAAKAIAAGANPAAVNQRFKQLTGSSL